MVISHGALTGSSWKQYWQYNQVFFIKQDKKKGGVERGPTFVGYFFF